MPLPKSLQVFASQFRERSLTYEVIPFAKNAPNAEKRVASFGSGKQAHASDFRIPSPTLNVMVAPISSTCDRSKII